jgi:hypothetical protein
MSLGRRARAAQDRHEFLSQVSVEGEQQVIDPTQIRRRRRTGATAAAVCVTGHDTCMIGAGVVRLNGA